LEKQEDGGRTDYKKAKSLPHFYPYGGLSSSLLFRQWVGSRGESDHYLIFLEVAENTRKLEIPFKFKFSWLKEEECINLV